MFTSLNEAIRAGYMVDSKTQRGYRVKTRTAAGWVYADVVVA